MNQFEKNRICREKIRILKIAQFLLKRNTTNIFQAQNG